MFQTSRSARRLILGCIAAALFAALAPAQGYAEEGSADERSAAIAAEVMQALGGAEAWQETRFVSWLFFERRQHYWDRWSGDIRIQDDEHLILMNINTGKGRAWVGGQEITEADSLAKLLDRGHAWWINDSYWLFMPYKLRDPGVTLRYLGERDMQDGRPADVLELTFKNVGRTPDNKYEVCVDKETHLVGEWSYYTKADDPEPRFTGPWTDWQRVGRIMLAGSRGRDKDWKLAVYDDLPRSVFESPEPVQLEAAHR